MTEEERFVELVRIGDPIQADLLAAFLEDGEIDFQCINRTTAGLMAQLMPRAQNPVIFRVREEDLERAEDLLAEYRKMQEAELIPSEIPPPPDDGDEEGE